MNIEEERLFPAHIAIIMDGNGRWAQTRGLPRITGHRRAVTSVRDVVTYCAETPQIRILTLYAFSSENWKRPKREVEMLMRLLKRMLRQERKTLDRGKVKLGVIGDKRRLPADVRDEIKNVEQGTSDHDGLLLNLAINYGSRGEITRAVRGIARRVVSGKLEASAIDQKVVSDHLYTAGMPDPDLLIRTAGEQRLSNFLLWQLSYSEFYFTSVLWPDFRREDLVKAIREYRRRKRRFGGLANAE